MSFCGGHFEFCWVIFIMTYWLEFRVCVFWQPFWTGILDFGFQDFKLQKSPLSFCTFKYIYIYLFVKWNRIQSAQYTHLLVSLLTLCCITIRDASPTSKQRWFNVLCVTRVATVILIVTFKRFKSPYQIHNFCSILGNCLRRWPWMETLDVFLDVFLLSNLETKRWGRSGHRGTLFTLFAMNGESPAIYTIVQP